MRQYWAVKHDAQYSGCVVLFQLGGFYEAFYDDARLLSSACGVVLTARGDVPMAGLPVDRAEGHVLKLLRRGHKVVLVDQMDPVGPGTNPFRGGSFARPPTPHSTGGGGGKPGLISRSASRVLTPGTSADLLGSTHASNHYLASVAFDMPTLERGGRDVSVACAVAWADVSTGELCVKRTTSKGLAAELSNVSPAELVLPSMLPDLVLGADASGPAQSSPTILTRDSMAVEAVHRVLRQDQCKVVHDVMEQRRAGGVAAGRGGASHPAWTGSQGQGGVVKLVLQGGDTEGCWVTLLPQACFGQSTGAAMLRSLAAQHGGPRQLELSPLEASAASGLLRYLSWTFCGALPRLAWPLSLTSVEEQEGGGATPLVAVVHAALAADLADARAMPAPPMTAAAPAPAPAPASALAFRVPPRLSMNEATQRALELVRPMHGRRRAQGSLLDLIDVCKTHMGSRMLDGRLVRPLASLPPLLHRLDAVEALCGPRLSREGQLRTALRDASMLGSMPDLERCFQRVSMGLSGRSAVSASSSLAKDLCTLRDGLATAHAVGLLLGSRDPLLLRGRQGRVEEGVEARVMKDIEHAAARAVGCTGRALQGVLLKSSVTEFDVVWEEGAVQGTRSGDHTGPPSHVLAQCASVLTTALRRRGGEEHWTGLHPEYRALAEAHVELVDALAQPGVGAATASPSTFVIRRGYDGELDKARERAANTALLRKELEDILRADMGLPPDAPSLRIKGGIADVVGAGRASDGLYIEVDVRAKPNRVGLDRHLGRQAGAMARDHEQGGETGVGGQAAPPSPTPAPSGPFARLKPSDLYLRPIRSTETLKRFKCEALGRLELEVAEAGARAEALEHRIVNFLATRVVTAEDAIKAVCKAVAVVDTASALAELADRHALVRPVLTDVGVPVRLRGTDAPPPPHTADVGCGELMLKGARHLVVEHALAVWHLPVLDAEAEVSGGGLGVEEEEVEGGTPLLMGLGSGVGERGGWGSHARHTSFVANDILLGASHEALVASPEWGAPWRDACGVGGEQGGGGDATKHTGAQGVVTEPSSPWQHAQRMDEATSASLAASRCVLLLGPNMGGKSTYLRTAAQAVVLAQCGSFVPAASARMGVVDAIFCRVGASDDLAGHRSTFRVEMEETGDILSSATHSSLVVIDEVGRGTAVADGLALSTAIVEELVDIGARTLFATHFPELAAAALPRARAVGAPPPSSPVVRAMFMEWVADGGGTHGTAPLEGEEGEPGILVTHRVKLHPLHAAVSGGAGVDTLVALLGSSVSHGLSVARHAGLPRRVLARAGGILEALNTSDVPGMWARAVLDATEDGRPRAPVLVRTDSSGFVSF